jgi:hypothetical protein
MGFFAGICGKTNKVSKYFFHTFIIHNLRIGNKCICSISTGPIMSHAPWRNSYTFYFHLGIILIRVLGFYSGLSGRVMTV